jgi:hypothetical protein
MSKAHKTEPAKRGRPSKYTPELADEICERIANGEPLAKICRDERMPSVTTVWRWEEADEKFSQRVARARLAGFDEIAVDLLHIADTQEVGVTRKVEGDKITETMEDMLGHRKLRVETRLKLLACWDPKRYGTQRIEADMTNRMPDVAKATSTLDQILGLLAAK